jgi:TPP-dependent pyruvate/acetoin dehydrogenase alpha subunit
MNNLLAPALAAIAMTLTIPAQAQTAAKPAAGATPSADPIVQMRAEIRAANKSYDDKVGPARKERMAKVAAATDAAAKQAKAQGKDPMVARRDAKVKAMAATKADFDGIEKAAAAERAEAQAAARKKANPAKV